MNRPHRNVSSVQLSKEGSKLLNLSVHKPLKSFKKLIRWAVFDMTYQVTHLLQ